MSENNNENYQFEKNVIEKIELVRRRNLREQLILKVYSYVGIISALIAIFLLVLDLQNINLDSKQEKYLILLFAGGIFIVFPKMYNEIKKIKENEDFRDEIVVLNFLKEWKKFEDVLDKNLVKNGYETRKGAINHKINFFQEKKIFDELDLVTIKYLLKIRNQIVHEVSFEDTNKINLAIKELEEIKKKLN